MSMSYNDLLEANARLQQRVFELEQELAKRGAMPQSAPTSTPVSNTTASLAHESKGSSHHALTNAHIHRYGRQLILPEFGVGAQQALSKARVLVVGAGGLGAPICLYLAAAGVGHIGIIDHDNVELNNLHRQVIHSEASLGIPKAESARNAVRKLNSLINCEAYVTLFDETNAMELASQYDILVDATDNVATRYLINDAAILNKKIVVSGSALRMEGQVTVYGYKGGPCYRCLYPVPPPPETVTNCNDGGILGVVCGLIGCIQALEVIKIAGNMNGDVLSQRLLLFDAMGSTQFRTVKLRARKPNCAVCGDQPTVTQLINYRQFCSSRMDDKVDTSSSSSSAPMTRQVTVHEYAQNRTSPHVLLDVREQVQFDICALPNSLHIPLRELRDRMHEVEAAVRSVQETENADTKQSAPVYIMCRRGVFSLAAAELLRQAQAVRPTDAGAASNGTDTASAQSAPTGSADSEATPASRPLAPFDVFNVAGGLAAWTRHVDTDFPCY